MQIQNPTAIMIARTAVAQDDITGCVVEGCTRGASRAVPLLTGSCGALRAAFARALRRRRRGVLFCVQLRPRCAAGACRVDAARAAQPSLQLGLTRALLRPRVPPCSDGTTSTVLLIGALPTRPQADARGSRAGAGARAGASFSPDAPLPATGELMRQAQRHLAEGLHPRVICEARAPPEPALRRQSAAAAPP